MIKALIFLSRRRLSSRGLRSCARCTACEHWLLRPTEWTAPRAAVHAVVIAYYRFCAPEVAASGR
jgi:hypothetical protein